VLAKAAIDSPVADAAAAVGDVPTAQADAVDLAEAVGGAASPASESAQTTAVVADLDRAPKKPAEPAAPQAAAYPPALRSLVERSNGSEPGQHAPGDRTESADAAGPLRSARRDESMAYFTAPPMKRFHSLPRVFSKQADVRPQERPFAF
jgi:hypothetical protein